MQSAADCAAQKAASLTAQLSASTASAESTQVEATQLQQQLAELQASADLNEKKLEGTMQEQLDTQVKPSLRCLIHGLHVC